MSDVDEIEGIDQNVTLIQRSETVFNEEIQRRVSQRQKRHEFATGFSDDEDAVEQDSSLEKVSVSKVTDADRAEGDKVAFTSGATSLCSLYSGLVKEKFDARKQQSSGNEEEEEEEDENDETDSIDLPDESPSTENVGLSNCRASSSYILRRILLRSGGGDEDFVVSDYDLIWKNISDFFGALWMKKCDDKKFARWMKIPRSNYLTLVIEGGEEELNGEFSVVTKEGLEILVCPK
jgi:hypothetical protein